MSLTIAQRKALATAPKISGSCSLFFSGWIVWTVLSDAKKRKSPYHRLLCGISIVDMSTSFWLGLTTWPIPSDSGVMYAAGNEASCQVQGFWLQFAIASAFYNGSLSIYYLLLVRYGWRQARFRKSRIEWLFHAVPIAFGLGTASLALGADTLGNAFFWCWITSANPAYRWAVYYGPLWLIIVMVTAICWVMHRHVQRIEKETLQHIHKKNSNSNNSKQRLPSANPTLNDDSEVETLSVVSQSPPADSQAVLTLSARDNSSSRRPAWSEGFPASVLDRTTTAGRAASINNPYSSAGSIPNDSEDESNATNDAESATRTVPEQAVRQPPTTRFMRPTAITHIGGDGTTTSTFSEKKKELRRAKQVSRLCFQYAAAFYLNWSAVSCIRMIQIFDPDFVNFGLFLVATFLVGIQGLPNFLIYLGPQVWKEMKQRRRQQRKQQEQQSQDRERSQQRPRDVLRQMSGSGTPSQERQHRSFLMATLAESIGESPQQQQQQQVPPNMLSAKGEDAESAMAEARKRASAAIARHRQRIGATDDDDFENDDNDHVEEIEKGSKKMDKEWGTTSVLDVKHSMAMDPVAEDEDFLMEEVEEAENDQDTMSVDSQSRRSANGVEFVDEE